MIFLKIIFSILICIPFGYLLYVLFNKMMGMLRGQMPKETKRRVR